MYRANKPESLSFGNQIPSGEGVLNNYASRAFYKLDYLEFAMTKNQQNNDTNENNDYIRRMIDTLRKELAEKPKELSYEELVEIDPRLSDDSDF